MSHVLVIRASIREQLAAAGPSATAMLSGEAPLDADVVLGALEAAGLLDDATAGSAVRATRHALRSAVSTPEGADRLRAVIADLDLDPATLDLAHAADEDDLEQRLHGVLRAAAIAEVGGRAAGRLRRAVERNLADLELEPERYVGLAPIGARLSDALDLGDDHLAAALARAVAETPDLAGAEIGRAALDRGHDAARRTLFPSPLLAWRQAAARGAAVADFVARATATAPRLAAADDDPDELPYHPLALDPARAEQVVLLASRETARLGWAGPGPAPVRARLLPNGPDLVRLEARDDSVTWRIDTLPTDTTAVQLAWADGRVWEVPLDAP